MGKKNEFHKPETLHNGFKRIKARKVLIDGQEHEEITVGTASGSYVEQARKERKQKLSADAMAVIDGDRELNGLPPLYNTRSPSTSPKPRKKKKVAYPVAPASIEASPVPECSAPSMTIRSMEKAISFAPHDHWEAKLAALRKERESLPPDQRRAVQIQIDLLTAERNTARRAFFNALAPEVQAYRATRRAQRQYHRGKKRKEKEVVVEVAIAPVVEHVPEVPSIQPKPTLWRRFINWFSR